MTKTVRGMRKHPPYEISMLRLRCLEMRQIREHTIELYRVTNVTKKKTNGAYSSHDLKIWLPFSFSKKQLN